MLLVCAETLATQARTDMNKYTSVVVVRWIKRRRKTGYEEAARQTDAPTSCLRPLFDKPIRLRTGVRGTNRNSCLCSPVVSFFVRCFYLTNVRNRSKQIEMAGWNIYSSSHPSLLQESFELVKISRQRLKDIKRRPLISIN